MSDEQNPRRSREEISDDITARLENMTENGEKLLELLKNDSANTPVMNAEQAQQRRDDLSTLNDNSEFYNDLNKAIDSLEGDENDDDIDPLHG